MNRSIREKRVKFKPSPNPGKPAPKPKPDDRFRDRPAMLVVAEAAMTKKEIIERLMVLAVDRTQSARWGVSVEEIEKLLNAECDRRAWSNFQRRRTIAQIAARVVYKAKWTYRSDVRT